MAETLGSLCDKLTIVKLKQWHSREAAQQASLEGQEQQLREEIDGFVRAATSGVIPLDRLTFAANKVYTRHGPQARAALDRSLGQVVGQLAQVNCALWHEQEKVYAFEALGSEQKDQVARQLGALNLQRTACIERIDLALREAIQPALGKRRALRTPRAPRARRSTTASTG